MTGNKKIFVWLALLVAKMILGEVLMPVSTNDPYNLCENTFTGFPNSSYIKSCCQRGCRFFNLIDSRYKWEEDRSNGIKNACKALCSEAYINPIDSCICKIGCIFMAKQRVSDQLPPFTCMEKSVDILPTPPDIPENDLLTDPGLRKELLPKWWDADGFKLPQTHVKTIPMDAKTADYTQASDYSGESKQPASTSKSETFQQAKNILSHTEIYHNCIIAVLVGSFVFLSFYAILLWILEKQRSNEYKFYKNINFSKDTILFMPNEVVMYKISPNLMVSRHHQEVLQSRLENLSIMY